jgi:hypothetical protein
MVEPPVSSYLESTVHAVACERAILVRSANSVSLEDGARKEPKETGTHIALIKLSSKNKQISSIMHGNLP